MTGLLQPLRIGDVTLPNNLVLSPMAGFSDQPFRILCRRHGAGLVSSEMVGAGSLDHEAQKTLRRAATSLEERPTSIQVFGTDPDEVAQAAARVEPDCDVIGFNMGCPAHQIRRAGCGAALLDYPERCEAIVRAITRTTTKPLLVKIRAGNNGRMDVLDFGRRLEAAGGAGIIFHARTADQNYKGQSDWGLIRQLKEAVAIPVIGNGDVVDGPTARQRLEASGADGVALGRAALGDPRIFRRVATFLETGLEPPRPTPSERAEDYLAYLELATALGYETNRLIQQAHQFTRGVRGGSEIRTRLQGARTPVARIRAEFEALRLAA